MAKAGKYSLKEKLKVDELYDNYMGMPPRQQGLVAAGVILGLIILIIIPVTCASHRLGNLQKKITEHEKNVGSVLVKINEYNSVKTKLKGIENKILPASQVNLRSKIDAIAAQLTISSNIDIGNPNDKPGEEYTETTSKVRVSKLPLLQIIDLISSLEKQTDISLHVRSLTINPTYANRALFDGEFEVSTVAKSKEEGGSEK